MDNYKETLEKIGDIGENYKEVLGEIVENCKDTLGETGEIGEN